MALCVASLFLAHGTAQAQMATGTYVGNGAIGRPITGVGFRPNVVIIKVGYNDTITPANSFGVMRTSTMAGDNTKLLVNALALAPNLIQSLDADGFTVGNAPNVNANGTCGGPCNYHWIAFKANADVKVGTYTGNGIVAGDPQSITGLGFSPEYVTTLPAAGRRAVHRTNLGGTASQRYNGTAILSDAITSLDADGFTVVRSAFATDSQNTSPEVYHYVAWNAVPGRVVVGSHTGDGTDGRKILGVGFQPEYVIVEPINFAFRPNQRTDKMVGDASVDYETQLLPNFIQKLVSDGFEVGDDAHVNGGLTACGGGSCLYTWVAFNAYCPGCGNLSTAEAATTLTISTPAEQMVWDSATGAGGGLRQFFVKDEANPGISRAANNGSYPLWSTQVNDGVWHFEKDAAGRLTLLEATSTRVRLKQKYDYTTAIHLDRDLTVYGNPRIAIRENITLDSALAVRGAQGIHAKGEITCPGNTFYCAGRPDPAPIAPPPAGLVFLVADNGSTYSDMLAIPYTSPFFGRAGTGAGTDWEALEEDNTPEHSFFSRVWEQTQLATAAGTYTRFYEFYPRLADLTSTGTEWQPYANDYRAPDSLAVTIGGPWIDASENTGGGDDFNEAESAYALTLDPALGLRFDIDGTVANPRHHPFFKIRQWRSLVGPASVTLEGAPLTSDLDYHADVKPLARAYFAATLSWHSTLEDANSLVANLDVGTTGGASGSTTFVPARYGQGALFDAGGDFVSAGSNGSLDFGDAGGAVEFWYQPTYVHTDGGRHMLWSNQSVDDCFIFEKTNANQLVFSIIVNANVGTNCTVGGTTYSASVGSGAYAWVPGQWVHLKTAWRNTGLSRLEIFVDGVKLGNSSTFNPVGLSHGVTNFGGCPATCPGGGSPFASGIIDEPSIYTSNAVSQDRIGYAGLTADLGEQLSDPSKNYQFNVFATGTTVRRGQYLHFGSDSKFRGLNVALSTFGVGTGLDVVWEYWNGTRWADLESGFGFTDLTNHFTKSGNFYWTGDPAGWAPYSIDGGPDLYYVRAHLALGSYSTPPIEGLIKTDILLLQYCKDITLSAQTFVISPLVPTAVTLLSFGATAGASVVDLSWTTASELENLGFHLYRADSAGGPYTRITSSLIAGLGSSPTGRSYSYRDAGLTNGQTYYYQLEDVETTGRTERHGPVSATPHPASGGSPSPPPSGAPSGVTRHGDPTAGELRELERSPNHVVLELRTPGFFATPAGDGRVRLQIPGFESASRPGEPHVPMRRALVEAVAGRKVGLTSVQALDELRFPGLRPLAQGALGIEVQDNGQVLPSEEKRREGRAFNGVFPSESALLLGAKFQRETKMAELLFFPLRWDGSGLVLSRRLVVRLEFSGAETGETSRGGSRGRRRVERPAARSGVVAQLVAKGRGLYRVGYEEVFGAEGGQERRGIPVSSLRLSRQGESVVFHVEPDSATFGPGSRLYFLSEGSALNAYGDAVYEMETGADGVRMRVEALSSVAGTVPTYVQDVSREENVYYQAGLLDAPDLWLWDVVVSPGSGSYEFTAEGLREGSSSAARLHVEMQGGSDFEGVVDHHVRVRVNGRVVGETTWDGKQPTSLDLEVEPGVLQEGTNGLELEDVGDTGAAYSMVFLNRFRVSYPRRLEAIAGALEGRFEETGEAHVEGLPASSVVLDTTGRVPRWLTGASVTPAGLRLPVRAGRSYLLTSSFLRPEVRRVQGSPLRSATNRADYLLVAPRAFLGAASPLLALREGQGLVTKAVALEDMYAEFGHGEAGPEAIKAFLEYAYHAWAQPSVRYVVLLGDASYDPKDYLGTGVKDWLPGYPVRTSYLWTVSDPSYAAVNGEDLLPDLAIGRLPAGSVDEALRLVQKIVAYENGGGGLDGPAVLVADNPDLGGNFEADAEEIANGVLASRNPKRIYFSREGASTRQKIEDAFDEGASLMSYVGHGATAVWASENIFNYGDVKDLAPQSRQPFLLTLNCLNGFFHFPPLNSLSEELLKAEGKGAVGAFSPSGLSLNDAAHVYHKALLEEIVSGRHERIGDAILAAQERYAQSGAFPELLSVYNLLGDPALSLR